MAAFFDVGLAWTPLVAFFDVGGHGSPGKPREPPEGPGTISNVNNNMLGWCWLDSMRCCKNLRRC